MATSYDELQISVATLREKAGDLKDYTDAYSKALASFKEAVGDLENNWDDSESGVVAAFKAKYTLAEPSLTTLESSLSTLHTTMTAKADEFAAAEAAASQLF